MQPDFSCDLWTYLQNSPKKKILYGMGNGADKILAVCHQKGIEIDGVFASDGFVRGHSFHGMTVLTWSKIKEAYGAENVIVLLAFGSSRKDVLENIYRIAEETELYAPDVPAFGDGVFDLAFAKAHRQELEAAYALLSDGESRRIYENVVRFKLTGDIQALRAAESDPLEIAERLVRPQELRVSVDLGAYNGDTVRSLLDASKGSLQRIYAMEPDPRNFRKLETYAKEEERAEVIPFPVGAWSQRELLSFDVSGNRNASFGENRSHALDNRPAKCKEIQADTVDNLLRDAPTVDYIKYDVEGAEREALLGSKATVDRFHPTLLVSLYHRNEDLFALPLLVHSLFPFYQGFYLRRLYGIPAWDLNLYVK